MLAASNNIKTDEIKAKLASGENHTVGNTSSKAKMDVLQKCGVLWVCSYLFHSLL